MLIGNNPRLFVCCTYHHLLTSRAIYGLLAHSFDQTDARCSQTYTQLTNSDVDDTLTKPRQKITPEMLKLLENLRKECVVAFVGGSDFNKISEQVAKPGGNGEFLYWGPIVICVCSELRM